MSLVRLFLALLVLLASGISVTAAGSINSAYLAKCVDAIWWAEGGQSTRHPYGVMMPGVLLTPAEARVICERTVRRAFHRWTPGPGKESFARFLGRSYCPPSADPVGHANWIRNVTFFMAHPKKVSHP